MKDKTVTIVGAGIAGLVAAAKLEARGYQVCILEASRRLGGRIRTVARPFEDGQYVEAGARYIRQYHQRTLEIADALRLPMDDFQVSGNIVVHMNGRRFEHPPGVSEPLPAHLGLTRRERELGFNGIWRSVVRQVVPRAKNLDLTLTRKRELDAMTVAELLRDSGVSAAGISLFRLGLMHSVGEGVESYSAYSALRLARPYAERTGSKTIQGGTRQLPLGVRRRINGPVHCSAEVKRVQCSKAGVRITFGKREHQHVSKHVIMAIPLTRLRYIEFDPPLTEDKRRAIDHLPTTSVCRTYLQFRTRFWSPGSGVAFTDLPMNRCLPATPEQEIGDGPGILETYTTGPVARVLRRRPLDERVAFSKHYLKECFPSAKADIEKGCIKAYSMSWDDERWIQGGYGWFRPGQALEEGMQVRNPSGPVHFAGDHTSDAPAWMEGAIQSAYRVVEEITGSAGVALQ